MGNGAAYRWLHWGFVDMQGQVFINGYIFENCWEFLYQIWLSRMRTHPIGTELIFEYSCVVAQGNSLDFVS